MTGRIPTEIWVLLIRRSDIPYLNRGLAGLNLMERHVREALQWNIRQVFFWLEPANMPYDQALNIEVERVKSRLQSQFENYFIRTIHSLDELTVHEAERALAAPFLSLFSQQWMSSWSLSLVDAYSQHKSFEDVWNEVSMLPEMDEWKEARNQTVFYIPLRSERDWHWAQKRLGVEIVEQSRSGILGKNLNRRISLWMSRFLVQFEFSPMVWTVWNMVFGLLAASLILSPSYGWRALGVIVFYWSCIFDGVDGEIAKFRFESSEAGALLDMAGSWFNTLLFYGACLFSVVRAGELSVGLAQTILVIGAIQVILLSLYFSSVLRVPMGQGAWSAWDQRFTRFLKFPWISLLFRKDSFALLTVILVLSDAMTLLVWGLLGMLTTALGLIGTLEWKQRQVERSHEVPSEG